MTLRPKIRAHGKLIAVVVGGSMTFSGFYWNLISERLGRRISGSIPQVAPERASDIVDAIALLWSSLGLVVILIVLARMLIRARRVGRR